MNMDNQGRAQIAINDADQTPSCRVLSLHKESPRFSNGSVCLSARLESSRGNARQIWFEIPEEFFCTTTDSIEPFLIASIFYAMEEKSTLRVCGPVSQTLLRNLDQFQSAWRCWKPQRYAPVEIVADSVITSVEPQSSKVVAAFSGGVDSTFTIWRRTLGGGAFRGGRLDAGLLVHGFDIPLAQEKQFQRAAERARATLGDAGLNLLTMKSSLFDPDWEMTHGAALAACLSLLRGHFGTGLIASTYAYNRLSLPWGSNPITDPMLSGSGFSIVHDGADVSRDEKQIALSKWSAGYNNLRVCYEAADRDENCCRCCKCLMMFASLQALGLRTPASFAHEITGNEFLQLTNLNEAFTQVFLSMASKWRSGFGSTAWLRALARCARYNQRRIELEKPLANPLGDFARKVRLRMHEIQGP